MPSDTPTLVDLFSGCGGFGLGGEMAGFHSVVAIDKDATLQSAYRKNFPNTQIVTCDLAKLDENGWKLLLKGKSIDGVIGGPPCQGYSRQGHSDPTDERRTLLHHFFRNVNIISPKFFVMENVEGLMDKKNRYELSNALKIVDDKYTILEPFVVDASDHGAPTRRRRVVVIGYNAAEIGEIKMSDFTPPNESARVKDAIADMPPPIPQNKDKQDYGWAAYRPTTALSTYAQKMRMPPKKGLGSTEAIEKLNKGKTSGHFETVHSGQVAHRYATTPNGKIDKISKSKKLAWDGLCPTLKAGTGSDRGSHQAVRPLHPDVGRVITVREAARLQGFPDWFCFHPTKWHSFRMIGNSVSPIVSEAILTTIMKSLKKENLPVAARK